LFDDGEEVETGSGLLLSQPDMTIEIVRKLSTQKFRKTVGLMILSPL
jgi:hypothetical protein